jgi:hypothetical protein
MSCTAWPTAQTRRQHYRRCRPLRPRPQRPEPGSAGKPFVVRESTGAAISALGQLLPAQSEPAAPREPAAEKPSPHVKDSLGGAGNAGSQPRVVADIGLLMPAVCPPAAAADPAGHRTRKNSWPGTCRCMAGADRG